MRRVLPPALLLLLAAASCAAGPPTISGDKQIPAGKMARVRVVDLPPKAGLILDVFPEDKADVEELPDGRILLTGQPGTYSLKVRVIDFESKQITTLRHAVTVGPDPGPTPPVPPGPTPDPPGPTPGPAPIPDAGFRVLIVYETATVQSLPAGQQNVLFGRDFRDFLDGKCVAEAGGTKAYRIYDKDVKLDNESAVWQAAMKRPRPSVPWLVVSNGKAGFEGPLPATVADTIALCSKYATAGGK